MGGSDGHCSKNSQPGRHAHGHRLRHHVFPDRWAKVRAGQPSARRVTFLATEKLSQAGMHMGVAFVVMYWATGSAAFGGLAVVLEPACNMLLLPYHDRAWERFALRLETRRGMQPTPA
jgi:uncharacterized membrane protein